MGPAHTLTPLLASGLRAVRPVCEHCTAAGPRTPAQACPGRGGWGQGFLAVALLCFSAWCPGVPRRPPSERSTSLPVSASSPGPSPGHSLWWLLLKGWQASMVLVCGQHHLTCALGLNLRCQLNCSFQGQDPGSGPALPWKEPSGCQGSEIEAHLCGLHPHLVGLPRVRTGVFPLTLGPRRSLLHVGGCKSSSLSSRRQWVRG